MTSMPSRKRTGSTRLAANLSTAIVALAVSATSACTGPGSGSASERAASSSDAAGLAATGSAWATWRGPHQDGVSSETGLPGRWEIDGENHRWSRPIGGRGTPVIAGGRIYVFAHEGDGIDRQELLVCLDEATGRRRWTRRFSDFLSDSVYGRYAIGAPTIDPSTGNIFLMTTPGLVVCVSPDGDVLWQRSMMEEFGRLTFPNGRTGAILVDGDLAIAHVISASWGKLGPARDRLYAFRTDTGEIIWASTPGTGPKDSSFAFPVMEWRDGRRLLYMGTGCGNVVCVDVRTGDPVWRFPMSIGGLNSNVLLDGDRLYAIHGRENFDVSAIGRMVAIRLGAEPAAGEPGPVVLGKDHEIWRNDLSAFTSSPVLVGDRIYQTDHTGNLCCVNAATGAVLWQEKLAPDQIHASPVYGDGRLYVPMTNGSFYIIEPSDTGPKILEKLQLEGQCLGAPAIASGRVYVLTTERLYCFGRDGGVSPAAPMAEAPVMTPGPAVRLVAAPSEIALRPGHAVAIHAWEVDGKGNLAAGVRMQPQVTIPPSLQLTMSDRGLTAPESARPGAGRVALERSGRTTTVRARVLPDMPFGEDFNDIPIKIPHKSEPGVKFAFPPASWIGGKLKWEVRDLDGEPVLTKTLDRPLFQRATTFIGHPESRDYTVQMDIMSDGNRRTMCTAGTVNQRYLITLKGSYQQIEISSNVERIKETVPFRWRPGIWYCLKSRVDHLDDGAAVIRAKAWPRDEPEPDEWTIEFTHPDGHPKGAPGIFGFSPQSRFRVYVDNIMVTSND